MSGTADLQFWSTAVSGVLSSSLARCHRILRVRLRFQQSNLQQKNSVYIEFADTASADAALASPPLQPGSSSKRLECLHKQDYEKQQRSFVQSSSLGTSTGKRKQGSADSTGDNAGHFSVDLERSRTRRKSTPDKTKQIDELQGALQKEQAESARLREIAKQVGLHCNSEMFCFCSTVPSSFAVTSNRCWSIWQHVRKLSICRLNRKRLKLSTRQNWLRAN